MLDASMAGVLVLATVVAAFFHRCQLPPVLGFMLTGALTGPYGLKWMHDMATIEGASELGLVFLLFMVGLELSPAKLKRMKSTALNVGVRYMGLGTLVLGTFLWLFLKAPPFLAYVLGGVLSLSSTALVIKCLEEAQATASTVGRVALGTLIVQDIALIPLLLLVPALSSVYQNDATGVAIGPLLLSLIKAFGVLILIVALSFRFIPQCVDRLAQTRNRELFTLFVFSLGIGMAFLTHWLGLSMEAGAFVAGLALSGSLYSKQVLSDSRPFRDVFASIFFVSLGALFDVQVVVHAWPSVLSLLLALFLSKSVIGMIVAKRANLSWKVALVSGLLLFQVGELAFMVLHHLQVNVQSLPVLSAWVTVWMAPLIHAIILSLWLTPLLSRFILVHADGWLSRWMDKLDHATLIEHQIENDGKAQASLKENKVLIVGYGPIAQQLAEALRLESIAYHVLETNATTVKNLHSEGIPALYGDATLPTVLESAAIKTVEMLVVTVPLLQVATAIIFHARQLNPELRVVARAKFQSDVAPLYAAGADSVIYDELEAGHRFIHYSLVNLGFSLQESHRLSFLLRQQFEEEFHPSDIKALPEASSRLALVGDVLLEWVTLSEASPLLYQSLEKSQLRQKTGVNIVSIIKGDTLERQDPHPHSLLQAGDVLIVLGRMTQLEALHQRLGQSPWDSNV
jgi:CPA2 family monovalent cation:H+ antiporter-2